MTTPTNFLSLLPADILTYAIMEPYNTILELVGVNKSTTTHIKNILYKKYKKYGLKYEECIKMEEAKYLTCNSTDARQNYKIKKHDLDTLEHSPGKRKNIKLYNFQHILIISLQKFKTFEAISNYQIKQEERKQIKSNIQQEKDRKANEEKRKQHIQQRIHNCKPLQFDRIKKQMYRNDFLHYNANDSNRGESSRAYNDDFLHYSLNSDVQINNYHKRNLDNLLF